MIRSRNAAKQMISVSRMALPASTSPRVAQTSTPPADASAVAPDLISPGPFASLHSASSYLLPGL